MIEYGLACLAVLCLCAGDRVALRWAVLLGATWAAQLLPYHINPAMNGVWANPIIDTVAMGVMVALARQHHAAYAGVVFALTIGSQAATLMYFTTYALGVDTSELYYMLGCITFAAQLAIVGTAGAPMTWKRGRALFDQLLDAILPHPRLAMA